jgi:hypothetical protein
MIVLTEMALFFGRRYEKSRPIIKTPVRKIPRCRFCAAEIEPGKAFCDACGKAQA